MNHKQMVVANVQYKKPTQDDAKRNKGLLRYLTYRDARYGHIQQEPGMERWHDHGMGASVGEIAKRCDDYQSQHVLAFTLVFNPNPELMAMVPFAEREALVKELTETSLQRFFEARGVEGGIEFGYVLHHRESENPQSPGLHDPHTHVILPGSFYDEGAGERVPLYFSRNKSVNHIELLHQTTEQTLRELLERAVGLDWEQRFDALEAVREAQKRIIEAPRQGIATDEAGRTWDIWLGTRITDETHTTLGYYRAYPTDPKSQQTSFAPDELTIEFRPLASGLAHEQAERLGEWMRRYAHDNPDEGLTGLFGLAKDVGRMTEGERHDFFAGKTAQPEVVTESQEFEQETEAKPSIGQRDRDIDFF